MPARARQGSISRAEAAAGTERQPPAKRRRLAGGAASPAAAPVKVENKHDQHSESKHQQGLVRLQEQQGQELKQLKQEQQQRASARAQWEQEAAAATAGGSEQGGAGQLSATAGGGAGASANQGTQQQQGQPNNGASTEVRGVKLEPVDQRTREDTPGSVFVGTAVRRKFPGYGWYSGFVRRARSAGASVEYEVEWEDGSRAWIKQGDTQKYAARYAEAAGAGADAGAGGGAGSGARGSF